MSYFSTALREVINASGLTQAEIARRADVTTGQLSKYASATAEPEKDSLERLCSVFPPAERAKLVLARVRDVVPESSANLISFVANDGDSAHVQEEPLFYNADLPSDVREALDYLNSEAKTSESMREAIIAWVKVMRS